MEPFSAIYVSVSDQIDPVYSFMTGLAMVIAFAAMIASASRATFSGDLASLMRMVTSVGLLSVTVAFLPEWLETGQQIAYQGLETIGANPRETHQQYGQLITGGAGEEEPSLGDLWRDGGIRAVVIYVATIALGWLAWGIVWLAWVVQQFALMMGLAVAPLMLSLVLLDATRGIGIRFAVGLLALALLPLGWAVLDIGAKVLLNWAVEGDVYVLGDDHGILAGIQTLVFIVILALYNLVSVVLAPFATYRLFNSGSQIGVSAAQGLQTSLATGVSYAAGAGATSAMAGAGPIGIGGASVAAGGAGMVSGAMGSGGLMVPAAIGSVALMASGSSAAANQPSAKGDIDQQAAEIAQRYKR